MNRSAAVITTLATTITLIGVTTTAASADAKNTGSTTAISSWPAEGTGGLILRDINGRDLGSGIGEHQDFGFNGCGPEGSGLIRVIQLKRGGGGGWGPLYSGYVKKRWTQAPQLFRQCK